MRRERQTDSLCKVWRVFRDRMAHKDTEAPAETSSAPSWPSELFLSDIAVWLVLVFSQARIWMCVCVRVCAFNTG